MISRTLLTPKRGNNAIDINIIDVAVFAETNNFLREILILAQLFLCVF